MGRRLVIGLVLAVVVVAFTYFSSEEQQVPISGRTQRVAMSDEQQSQLGLQVYEQTLAEEGENVLESGPEYEQVKRVSERIAEQGAVYKPEFDWDFSVVDRDEANAFCLPGGKIVVFTGLLDIAKSDDQLAAVVGHEVAHAVAEHGAERIFQQELTQRGVAAASGAFADDPARYQQVVGLLSAGTQVGVLKWGRDQESESDRLGLRFMARAGYKPEAAIEFWQEMQKSKGAAGAPEFLSTHPSGATRIRQLREWLPEAKAEQREARDS